MSIATFEQLVINNERNDIFTDNPSITFFKPTYRRYVNYEKIEKSYKLPKCKFGAITDFIFPKVDYINNLCLSVILPEIKCEFDNWTKGRVKEELKKYGFNWKTEDLNKKMTNDDFKELVEELFNRENGLVIKYVDKLLKEKENINNFLIKITNVIKDFINELTYDKLNELLYREYNCKEYLNLLIDYDNKFMKYVKSIDNKDLNIIHNDLLSNGYTFKDFLFNNGFDYDINLNENVYEGDILLVLIILDDNDYIYIIIIR